MREVVADVQRQWTHLRNGQRHNIWTPTSLLFSQTHSCTSQQKEMICHNVQIQLFTLTSFESAGHLQLYVSFINPSYIHKKYFAHTGSRKTGLKWSRQLITQIWRLINGQCIHPSKIKHVREALDNNTKELILNAIIMVKHVKVWDTLLYQYDPYFCTPLSTILDTLVTSQKTSTISSRLLTKQLSHTNT